MGRKRVLPQVRFDMMNTIDSSTGFSPFQLRMGQSPWVISPFITSNKWVEDIYAINIIKWLELDVEEAKDNMLCAKISQLLTADKHRTDIFPFKTGGQVVLSTLHRWRNFKATGERRVAKFTPCFDSSYTITNVSCEHSTVTINMPNDLNVFPIFHASQVLPFVENEWGLFPKWEMAQLPPMIINNQKVFLIDHIIDKWWHGHGMQYLVWWL